MADHFIFTNNAKSTLASGINTVTTSIFLNTGDGALFPSPGAGEQFPVTLVDSSGNIEICYCTSRSTDTLTVVRAREGTTGTSFLAGDVIELRVTGGVLSQLLQLDSLNNLAGINQLTATTILAALTGNVNGNVTGNVSGTAASITGNLTGDVTSAGMATTLEKGLMQSVTGSTATYSGALTGTVPFDDTIPSPTSEGNEVITVAITPDFADSSIEVSFTAQVSSAATSAGVCYLVDKTAGTVLRVFPVYFSLTGDIISVSGKVTVASPGTSANTYSLRVGATVNTFINGNNTARKYGGSVATSITAKEIK